jgi:hypothetical protein
MIDIIPLQTDGVSLPALPSGEIVALVVLALLAGMAVPTAYGIERLQGFGRAVVSKVPYRPPPGMEKKEALRLAVAREESTATEQPAEVEETGDGDVSG